MLACGVAALGAPAAVATADPSSDEVVSATVYSATGTMQNDSVSLAQLESNPQCTPYSGTDMNELGRNGFVDVQFAPNATWALSTVLGCLSSPVPVSAVHGITVINSQGSPEDGPGSMLKPEDLLRPGLDGLQQSSRSSRGSGAGVVEPIRPAVARKRPGPAGLRLPRRGTGDKQRSTGADRDRGVRGPGAHRHGVRVGDDGAGRRERHLQRDGHRRGRQRTLL